jgi:O-antigen biosynthesis protein WbqP
VLKRSLDLFLALGVILVLAVPLLITAIAVKLTSTGPVLYWSKRVGNENALFDMPKLRSMRLDAPTVATHVLESPEQYLTPIGGFLRGSSIDELPQLFSILRGQMSFVGPRAALFNQYDLIQLRTEHGIHELTPGLTGWAQIHGRDELPIEKKVELDQYYLENRSLMLDLRIIFLTVFTVLRREGIHH